MENNFYKPSVVHLKASHRNGKTVLSDVYFTAPYKIMNPFYKNGDYMTIMCMSSSSGIMAGDILEFTFDVEEDAHLEFISQSYERIHKMEEGHATRIMQAKVAKNALFYYNPLPTQPFKDSAFENICNVHLEDKSSVFIMKEILTGGRISRGEKFAYRFYHNLVNIYVQEKLLYRDNTRFHPDTMDLDSLGVHEGYTHLGTLLLVHVGSNRDWVSLAREEIAKDTRIDGGVTEIEDGTALVRVLGTQSEHLEQILDRIAKLPLERNFTNP